MSVERRVPRVILASTSPYRKSQLECLRIPFDALAPHVDEAGYKMRESNPRALALELAIAKAEAIASQFPEAVVIGGDQLVSFEGEILGKPLTQENAVEQLLRLAGHRHELITAVAVRHQGETQTHVDQTQLWMRDLDRATAERYVAADQPLDCAARTKSNPWGFRCSSGSSRTITPPLPDFP